MILLAARPARRHGQPDDDRDAPVDVLPRARLAFGLTGTALLFVSVATAAAAPVVDGIDPPAGAVGHVVTLRGSGLAGAALEVGFGGAQARDPYSPGGSDRIIRVRVPNKVDPRDPDVVTVSVKVDGIEAATPAGPLQFTYRIEQPPPGISDYATGDPLHPRFVFANEPFVLTLSGTSFLTGRRVPQRCVAIGGEVRESDILAGPPGDTVVSFSFPGLGVGGGYEFLIAFSDGSGASIQAPDFVSAEGGIFGNPPDIEDVTFETIAQQPVRCDFTGIVQDYLCSLGAPGAAASPGVFIAGSDTMIVAKARVTDPESTPEQSNVLLVAASYDDPVTGNEISLVLFDDGSATRFPFPQKATTVGEECTDESSGVCACSPRQYLLDSNDSVAGDSEYSRGMAFVNPGADPLLLDCIMRQYRQIPIALAAGSALEFRIEAVDRQGNLAAWPARPTATIGSSAFSCDGDECGCCFLMSSSPAVDCAGKPGMPSPDFPAGICMSF